jgi:hypothetical protein
VAVLIVEAEAISAVTPQLSNRAKMMLNGLRVPELTKPQFNERARRKELLLAISCSRIRDDITDVDETGHLLLRDT